MELAHMRCYERWFERPKNGQEDKEIYVISDAGRITPAECPEEHGRNARYG